MKRGNEMAVNTIDIPINVKMSISKETADMCVQLVNMFLEENEDYVVGSLSGSGDREGRQIFLAYRPVLGEKR